MDPTGLGANCQVARDSPFPHECTDHATHKMHSHAFQRKNQSGWRRIVLNFTPSWFSVNMGTGIVSILLHNLPYNARWIYWVSVVTFAINVLLFVLFATLSMLRYTLFPGLFTAMLRHPVQSLFLGTIPMALATIVNMTAFVCVPAWGYWAIMLAWSLWWVDVVVSVACCMVLPFVIMSIHESNISSMTAAWLLPIVPTIVAAASGGIVAGILPDPQHALWTITTCYVLWGTGVPLAMCVLSMYFHRLTMHKLPPREVIVSVFLPLGPLGQGGFAIMQLGKVAMEVMPFTSSLIPGAGKELYVLGFALALIMWGFGLVWFFFALASISKSKFPFNMGWWGFTFPLGVFTVSTVTIGKELPSLFFKVLGTILSLLVVVLWIIVSARTVENSIRGTLFLAPCVAGYQEAIARKEAEIVVGGNDKLNA